MLRPVSFRVISLLRKRWLPCAASEGIRRPLAPLPYSANSISTASGAASLLLLCMYVGPAYAWGDEGHEIIGRIADHYLKPAVRAKINAILAGDTTHLTANSGMVSETTWADKLRDSDRNTTKTHYNRTRSWHFVDLEVQGPDLRAACFGRPALPKDTPASLGPANDCVVDKIDEFAAELKKSTTKSKERRLALQFVLHFVGDVHQPLHACDDHDRGGNSKIVTAPGLATNNLHHDWDTEFVARLGPDEATIAQRLVANISEAQRRQWEAGTAIDWAQESFAVGKNHVYALLPAPDGSNHYSLSEAYLSDATRVTQEQLSKAGVRLAFLLNRVLN